MRSQFDINTLFDDYGDKVTKNFRNLFNFAPPFIYFRRMTNDIKSTYNCKISVFYQLKGKN